MSTILVRSERTARKNESNLNANKVAEDYGLEETDFVQKVIDSLKDNDWRKLNRLTGKMETVLPKFRAKVVAGISAKMERDLNALEDR